MLHIKVLIYIFAFNLIYNSNLKTIKMKKIILSTVMSFALLLSVSVMAQDTKETKKEGCCKAKTECTTAKKDGCTKKAECTKKADGKDAEKKSCCTAKTEKK